jgi:hypothetical protein
MQLLNPLSCLRQSFEIARFSRFLVFCGGGLIFSTGTLLAWSPGSLNSGAVSGFTVNRFDRRDVLAYHNTVYSASEGYAARMGWTGNMSNGRAGETSAAFKGDVLRRINYYRALCGLPADVIFNDVKSAKCQEAALMFSSMSSISHNPPTSWTHYTRNASEAAANSNISWGSFGPGAVNGYIFDDGGGNHGVGHRRWILYSRAREMGTGDVSPSGTKPAANALWTIGNNKPAPPPAFVAWPNDGFSPRTLTPKRWSLSRPGASFAQATITMTRNETSIPLRIVSTAQDNVGDSTLVWEPQGVPLNSTTDETYRITVSRISGTSVPTSFTYNVILFDPANLGESVSITGPSQASSGTSFQFNSIEQAESYQLRTSSELPSTWVEGAEDGIGSAILAKTSGSYDWIQSSVKRSGSKAFYLAFPKVGDPEQVLEIARELLPTANATITFHDLFRFMTQTTKLSLQGSADGGLTWFELWSRNGNGSGSWMDWDQSFQARSVSLARFAGVPTRLRFVLKPKDSVFYQANLNDGAFLDDISVSECGELVSTKAMELPASATAFVLNANTAGAPLVTGSKYHLRIRPKVGTLWFGDGPIKTVVASFAGPEISVAKAGGEDLKSQNSSMEFPSSPLGKISAALTVVIRNDGDSELNRLAVSKSGAHAADFILGTPGALKLAPGNSTSFNVSFAPTAGGNRTGQIRIASNDADEQPFILKVTGFGLSPLNDTDTDGVSDAAEFEMATLGFDWKISQPEKARAFVAGLSAGGSLHTTSPTRSAQLGIPLVYKNPSTGKFELSIALNHSRDSKKFQPFSLNSTETTIEPDGTLKIRFTPPFGSEFLRLQPR